MLQKLNRRDHYLPQGYLRGFIDPARLGCPQPLWQFDIPNNIWSERSPREVGYRYGFYDYTTEEVGLETADTTFSQLESGFPKLRRELIQGKFRNWTKHRDFLLRYVQMMRARSLLFFEHQHEQRKNLKAWVVEEVSADRKTLKVRPMAPDSLPDAFVKNWSITEMRAEIKKGAAWLNDFNWALRYCESPAMPFIISEIPFISLGNSPHLADALQNPETLLFFPLCWQACLIGSRQFFDVETDRFDDQDMIAIRRHYRDSAKLFLLSPRQIDLH